MSSRRSDRDHLAIINQHHRPTFKTADENDHMRLVAKKVRLPTAHMKPLAERTHVLQERAAQVGMARLRSRRALLPGTPLLFNMDLARVRRNGVLRPFANSPAS